jgi:hypothetical protein
MGLMPAAGLGVVTAGQRAGVLADDPHVVPCSRWQTLTGVAGPRRVAEMARCGGVPSTARFVVADGVLLWPQGEG